MADSTDVQNTLAAMIFGMLYPSGTGLQSVVGSGVRVFAGWPNAAQLDADLRDGISQVSIFAGKNERNVTRHQPEWRELARGTRTIIATVSPDGATVAFSGTITTPQNIAVHCRGKAYTYAVQSLDTLSSIAAALALLISRDQPATSTGATLSIPAGGAKVNIGVGGTLARIIRRQEKQFMISVWAPTPELRSSLSKRIDVLLSSVNYIELPDPSAGRIIYVHSYDADEGQKAIAYRRDLTFMVEYPTLELTGADEITVVATDYDISPTVDGADQVTIISRGP